jgi:hypothetical protein
MGLGMTDYDNLYASKCVPQNILNRKGSPDRRDHPVRASAHERRGAPRKQSHA